MKLSNYRTRPQHIPAVTQEEIDSAFGQAARVLDVRPLTKQPKPKPFTFNPFACLKGLTQ